MNKILSGIVFLFLLSTISFAQNKNVIGIVVGPNHFSLRGSDDAKAAFGFSIGLSFERKFSQNLSLITGLTFVERNLNYNSQFTFAGYDQFDNYYSHDYKVKTNNKYRHFTIPFLLKYGLGKNKSFFINGGGYISTKGKDKKTTRLFNETVSYSYNVPTIDKYNFEGYYDVLAFDFGASFGFGKSFKLNPKTNVSLEVRDNIGFAFGDNTANKTNTLNLITQLSFDL